MSALVFLGAFLALLMFAAAMILVVKEQLDKRREANKKWQVYWYVVTDRYSTRVGWTRVGIQYGNQRQRIKELPPGHDPVEFDVELERAQEVCDKRNSA